MATTEALLADMDRRRQELYLKGVMEEEARRQL
jgi:hypothetical protein